MFFLLYYSQLTKAEFFVAKERLMGSGKELFTFMGLLINFPRLFVFIEVLLPPKPSPSNFSIIASFPTTHVQAYGQL